MMMVVLGIAVSVLAGYFAVRGVAWSEFSGVSSSIKWHLIGLAILGLLVAEFIRSVRWITLLHSKQKLPLLFLFQIVMIGLLLNLLIPLRIGDVFRGVVLRKHLDISYGVAGASLITERIFDVLTLALLFAVVAAGVSLPGYLIPVLGVFVAITVLGTTVLFLIAIFPQQVVKQTQRMSKAKRPIVKHLSTFVTDFVVGLAPTVTLKKQSELWVYSFAIRLAEVGAVAAALLAVNIDIGISGFVLVNSLTMLGLAIPSGPGAIGSFELLARMAIETFAVQPSTSLFGAVTIHAVHIVTTLIFGGIATLLAIRRIRSAGISLSTLTMGQEMNIESDLLPNKQK